MFTLVRSLAAFSILAVGLTPNAVQNDAPNDHLRHDAVPPSAASRALPDTSAIGVRYVRDDRPESADALRERMEAIANLSVSARNSPAISIARSYGPCVLHPGVIYLRKEYHYKAVGMKPFTKCDESCGTDAD